MQHWMIFVFTKCSFGIFFYCKGGLWSESFSRTERELANTVSALQY
jgi:hypothetical protein